MIPHTGNQKEFTELLTGSKSSALTQCLSTMEKMEFLLRHNDAGLNDNDKYSDDPQVKKKSNLKLKNTPDEYWIMAPFGE